MTQQIPTQRLDGIGPALLFVLALLSSLAPFAIDMYLPAFPAMTMDLNTSAAAIQLTLTAFFLGIAVGQLVFGPLSDRFGRVRPLVIGTALLVVASAIAALAPSIAVLIAARFVQGLAGAAGMVIGRAIVSDLSSGKTAARAFSMMMLVSGVAPILAPFAGSLLVGPLGWRGVLWAIAALSGVMLVAVLLVVRESHPTIKRTATRTPHSANPSPLRALGSRAFVTNTVTFIFSFAVMMAYIAASPFVYQVMLGMNEVTYGIAFGVNAIGLVAASALAARLSHKYAPAKILRTGLIIMLTATFALLMLTLTGAPTILIPIAIFFAVASIGLVLGNATALALGAVSQAAGTASAILGAAQFILAAAVSPLVGIAGEHTAIPLALCMFGAAAVAFLGHLAAYEKTPK